MLSAWLALRAGWGIYGVYYGRKTPPFRMDGNRQSSPLQPLA